MQDFTQMTNTETTDYRKKILKVNTKEPKGEGTSFTYVRKPKPDVENNVTLDEESSSKERKKLLDDNENERYVPLENEMRNSIDPEPKETKKLLDDNEKGCCNNCVIL